MTWSSARPSCTRSRTTRRISARRRSTRAASRSHRGWAPTPRGGTWAHDPHSAVAARFGPEALTGGLLDGPVYRSIYANLRGIALHQADEYAPFNTGSIVYHDDIGDYSTNEPIMDGTASLVYLLAALGEHGR